MDLRLAAIRGAAWVTVAQIFSQLVALGVFVALGRLLAPSEFGLVAAASIMIWFLRIFVDSGLSGALVQRPILTEDHVDTAFWSSVIGGVAFGALAFVTAPLVASLFGEPRLVSVVRALSVVFLLAALDGTQSALIDRRMAFKVQAVRGIIAIMASGVVAVILAVRGAGVYALVAQDITLEVVTVSLLWSLSPWRPQLRFSFPCFREMFGYGIRISGIKVLDFLDTNADNLLIGIVIGAESLGYYVVGYRVLIVINAVLVAVLSRVAFSLFSRLQGADDHLEPALYTAIRLNAVVVVPVYGGLAALAPSIVPLVFGRQWLPSVPIMQILAAQGVVLAASTLLQSYVLAQGKAASQLEWRLAVTLITVGAFILTVGWGIDSVALGVSGIGLVLLPIRVWRVARWSSVSMALFFRQYVGPLSAVIVMFAVLLPIEKALPSQPSWAALIAQVAVGTVVYLCALRVFAGALLREFLATARSAMRGSIGSA